MIWDSAQKTAYYGDEQITVKSTTDNSVLFNGFLRGLTFTFSFASDNQKEASSIQCSMVGLAEVSYYPFHILASTAEECQGQYDRVFDDNSVDAANENFTRHAYSFQKPSGEILFTARLYKETPQNWFMTYNGGRRRKPPYEMLHTEKTQGIGYAENIYLDPMKQLIAAGMKDNDDICLTCDERDWHYMLEEYIASGTINYSDGRRVTVNTANGWHSGLFRPGCIVRDYVEIHGGRKYWYVADYSETGSDNKADVVIIFESDYVANALLRFEGSIIRQSVKRREVIPNKTRGYIAYYRIEGVVSTIGRDGGDVSENINLYNDESTVEEIVVSPHKWEMFTNNILNESHSYSTNQINGNTKLSIGLDDLIGLETVKTAFDEFRRYAAYRKKLSVALGKDENDGDKLLDVFKRRTLINNANLKDSDEISLHMVFLGSPGTGKTTVAERVAKMLKEYGILTNDKPLVVVRSDLVGQHIGETEAITRKKIEAAIGGVLFVDEAYTLFDWECGNDFGKIALNEIMYAMEKYHIVVILAGYTEEMLYMLKHANTGISSRINFIFTFSDYSAEEMWDILLSKVERTGYKFDDSEVIKPKTIDFFTVLKRDLDGIKENGKTHHYFGNGRGVKKFMQYMTIGLACRLANVNADKDSSALRTFTADDVEFAYAKFRSASENLKEEKRKMIGFGQS